MKTILLIDESELIRGYLHTKLTSLGFEVLNARNGFDGLIKLKNNRPDLVVMDYNLSRTSAEELLAEKAGEKATAPIPVILTCQKVEKEKIIALAKYKLAKVLLKPIQIDAVLQAIGEVAKVEVSFDSAPCVLEVHVNDEILFVELSRGLNWDKIELLPYKVSEILSLYGMSRPRVLVMITDVELKDDGPQRLDRFFELLVDATNANARRVQVLTALPGVTEFLAGHEKLNELPVTDNISEAMDALLGIKIDSFVDEGKQLVHEDFLSAKQTEDESLQLKFAAEKPQGSSKPAATAPPAANSGPRLPEGVTAAVVDDDEVIRTFVRTVFAKSNWTVNQYENGKLFLDDLAQNEPAVIFLDLNMPVLNGFEVLKHLREQAVEVPVIILSALTQKETIVKAQSFGVNSYIIKPLKPDLVRKKTVEALSVSF